MTTVFHAWPYRKFIETQSNLRRKKLHRTNQGSNFLGDTFSNRDNVTPPIQFRRESQRQHLKRLIFLKNRPIHQQQQCYWNGQTKLVQLFQHGDQQAPVHTVSQIRLNFRNQFQLLPQTRRLITFRVESSIISIDNNITDNIIRKVINEQYEKCRAKKGPLRNSSINQIFL